MGGLDDVDIILGGGEVVIKWWCLITKGEVGGKGGGGVKNMGKIGFIKSEPP